MFDLSKDGGAGNQGSSPMVGADGTIYMGASTTDKNISSSLYAIHPDGTQKWRYELGIGTNIPYISPALSRDGNILIGNRGRMVLYTWLTVVPADNFGDANLPMVVLMVVYRLDRMELSIQPCRERTDLPVLRKMV